MSLPKPIRPLTQGTALQGRSLGLQVLIWQGMVLLAVTTSICIWKPQVMASVLAGGLISSLAQGWFTLRVFRYPAGVAPHKVLFSLYSGEAGKLVIVALLFALLFLSAPVADGRISPPWAVAGFVFLQSVVWLAPWFLRRPMKNFVDDSQ